jgi:phosphopentomutase
VSRRVGLIVLDGVGIGPTSDQAAYGDLGSDTLGHVLARAEPERRWPQLEALGLGNCAPLPRIPPAERPRAAFGLALPASAGKDSTTGHWEICGVVLETPFPTFPAGFPQPLIEEFSRRTGRAVLGNKPASGTGILDQLGAEHCRTGSWIVYTSADSVFQLAAHEDVVSVSELYRACEIARSLCVAEWGVARIIARPFTGTRQARVRTERRKDFSLPPVRETLLDRVAAAGLPTRGIGKVDDLFAGRGIQSTHATTNPAAYGLIEDALAQVEQGLVFANVIEFDQSWGHRNDVPGFLSGLDQLDRAIPGLLSRVQEDDLVIFTADHGNDPTTPSTDHSRERVPVLVYGPKVRSIGLGTRSTFADIGQTVADFLGVGPIGAGSSFLEEIWVG